MRAVPHEAPGKVAVPAQHPQLRISRKVMPDKPLIEVPVDFAPVLVAVALYVIYREKFNYAFTAA